jgi:YD repeat-containing protein
VLTDPDGTTYPVNGIQWYNPPCSSYTNSFAGTTWEYSVSIDLGVSSQVTDVSGNTFAYTDVSQGTNYTWSITDSNSNKLSANWICSPCTPPEEETQTVTYTDTTNNVAFTAVYTIIPQNTFEEPVQDKYSWTDAAAAPNNEQSYTVTYSQYTQKTNFDCAEAADIPAAIAYWPSSIKAPDGRYTITYEGTPDYPGDFTGRVATIAFPSGASLQYSYTGGNNNSGLACASGSPVTVPVLTKTLTGANGVSQTWVFNTTKIANATVGTDQAGNDTVYTFGGVLGSGAHSTVSPYEVQRQYYQGSYTSNNLLKTVVTCYNGHTTNCTTATVGSTDPNVPFVVSQKDVYTTLAGMTQSSLSETTYTNTGLLLGDKEVDFTGTVISDRTLTYGSYSNGKCTVTDMPQDRVCTDLTEVGTTVLAQTNNSYDSYGNLTSSSRLVSGSYYLTSSATYNSNGTVNVATDVNGAQTTYGSVSNYACNGNFPMTVSEPLNLSKSMTWDCNGGVLTSLTDENSQKTPYGYVSSTTGLADPFYRPLFVTDPLSNVTNYTYTPTTFESAMNFNGTTSTSDQLATTDGLGRQTFGQRRQAQGSSAFDTTQTVYGWKSASNGACTNQPPFTTGACATQSMPYTGSAAQPAPSGTAVTTTQNDALGRPLTVTDGGGGTVSYTYVQNDVLQSVGPTQTFQKQFEYDGLGRLTSVCEITSASGSGTCGQSNPQQGYWTRYQYDALGDLTGVCQNTTVPLSTNCVTSPSAAQQTRTYAYDGLRRLTSESNPESNATSYWYDGLDNSGCESASKGDLVARFDSAGNVSCYAYDGLHRLTSVTYFNYNPNGHASVTPDPKPKN